MQLKEALKILVGQNFRVKTYLLNSDPLVFHTIATKGPYLLNNDPFLFPTIDTKGSYPIKYDNVDFIKGPYIVEFYSDKAIDEGEVISDFYSYNYIGLNLHDAIGSAYKLPISYP